MKAKRRIRTVEEQLAELRAQWAIIASTVEKLVEVVCRSEATAPAARREKLAQRLPY